MAFWNSLLRGDARILEITCRSLPCTSYVHSPQPSWWLDPVHLQQGFSLLRDSLSRISLQVPRQRQPLRGVLETYSLYDALDLRRGRNGRFCRAFSKGARESKCKVPATRFCAVLCFAVLPPTGDHWRSFFLQDTRPLPAAWSHALFIEPKPPGGGAHLGLGVSPLDTTKKTHFASKTRSLNGEWDSSVSQPPSIRLILQLDQCNHWLIQISQTR